MNSRIRMLPRSVMMFLLCSLLFSSAASGAAVSKRSVNEAGMIPARLLIPAIHVDAQIEPVGVLPNGHMGVPGDNSHVGLLQPWTKPGQAGNAVLDGHVDHKTGPAVFFYLKELKPGDDVILSDNNGKKLKFKVTSVESFKTQEAPLTRIFGAADRPRLNLITCTGRYDRTTNEHDQRLVVFTELVE